MLIYTFMENNNLNGKTVIPFCTRGRSDIEESMEGIKNAAQGTTVLKGLTSNGVSDIESWLKDIGTLK